MEELNDWLLDQCVARAKVQPHPEIIGKTVWEVFEAERSSLVPYPGALRRLPCRHGLGVQDLPRTV